MEKALSVSILSIFFSVLVGAPVAAATIHASDCLNSAVQSAINSARNGDAVIVPAGTCSWSSIVEIPRRKGITLQGAGIGNTVINLGKNYLDINTAEGNSRVRVTGFTFNGGPTGRIEGAITVNDQDMGAMNWRIDHCRFNYQGGGPFNGIAIRGYTWGLIDHCEFQDTPDGIFIEMGLRGSYDPKYYGDYSWMQPITPGGPDAVYIEDCSFANSWDPTGQAVEMRWGGRYVLRYSTIQGTYAAETHSGCTNGGRNPRWLEVYENTFNTGSNRRWLAIWSRSTNGVIFNNRGIGYGSALIGMDYEMACRRDCMTPWRLQTTYPGQDQIGRGQDSGWGTPQAPMGLWAWNNTLNGSSASITRINDCEEMQNLVKKNRDYFDSPKPGYTPYTYPHPLRSGSTPTLPSSDQTRPVRP